MGIRMKNGSYLEITDCSLPGLMACNAEVNSFQLQHYMQLSTMLCVDFFEVDDTSLRTLKRLPQNLNFTYRIKSSSDLSSLYSRQITRCIVTKSFLDENLLQTLKTYGKHIILECECCDALEIQRASILAQAGIIDTISFSGISTLEDLDGLSSWLLKDIPINVCPSNERYLATALAVDAALFGASGLNLACCGIGAPHGIAVLEEVVAALLIKNEHLQDVMLNGLSSLADFIEVLTKHSINPKKPLLGKSLFQYESGIHADGIGKNPATYEPFPPEWVGLKRELVVGKHSGTSALIQKLNEAGIALNPEEASSFLVTIREVCSDLGRSIHTEELINLFEAHFGKETGLCVLSN